MKKIISAILLIFMLSSVLVGCTVADSNTNNGDGQSTQSEGDKNGNKPDQENNNTGTIPNDEPTTPINPDDEPTTPINPDDEPTTPTEPDDSELTVGNAIGNLMQSIELEQVNGDGTVSVEDHRGSIVVLNIWATWCPPCKAELPDFERVAKEYSDKVVVIAAHSPSGRADAPSYVEENFPNSSIIFAYDTQWSDAYIAAGGDGYVPFTVVLDTRGVIVYSGSGMLSYSALVSIIESIES